MIVLLVIVIVEEVLVYSFDGVFLLNGLGDFVVIGEYVVLMIKFVLEIDLFVFGICLGY